MIRTWLIFIAGIIGLISVSGCGDPVRTTVQHVVAEVIDSRTGGPVADAQLSLQYNYAANVPLKEQRPHSQRPVFQKSSAKTDSHGRANVRIEWTMLDRTIGTKPPDWRPNVKGGIYLLDVKKGSIREEHSLAMQPEAIVTGATFTVRILDIMPPQYVEADRLQDHVSEDASP